MRRLGNFLAWVLFAWLRIILREGNFLPLWKGNFTLSRETLFARSRFSIDLYVHTRRSSELWYLAVRPRVTWGGSHDKTSAVIKCESDRTKIIYLHMAVVVCGWVRYPLEQTIRYQTISLCKKTSRMERVIYLTNHMSHSLCGYNTKWNEWINKNL